LKKTVTKEEIESLVKRESSREKKMRGGSLGGLISYEYKRLEGSDL